MKKKECVQFNRSDLQQSYLAEYFFRWNILFNSRSDIKLFQVRVTQIILNIHKTNSVDLKQETKTSQFNMTIEKQTNKNIYPYEHQIRTRNKAMIFSPSFFVQKIFNLFFCKVSVLSASNKKKERRTVSPPHSFQNSFLWFVTDKFCHIFSLLREILGIKLDANDIEYIKKKITCTCTAPKDHYAS